MKLIAKLVTALFTCSSLALASGPSSSNASTRWVDVDRDGHEDVFVFVPGQRASLLHNSGDGSFENRTTCAGLDVLGGALVALWEDYDGDGLVDVAAVDRDGRVRLLRNENGARFVDVTQVALPDGHEASAIEWRDVDGDGRSDLVRNGPAVFQVLRNTGSGAFEATLSVSLDPEAAPAGSATTFGVSVAPQQPEQGAGALDEHATAAVGSLVAPSARPRLDIVETAPAGDTPSNPATIAPFGPIPGAPTSIRGLVSPAAAGLVPGFCAPGIEDQAGGCLSASSVPTLGELYPLGDFPLIDPSDTSTAALLSAPDRGRPRARGGGRLHRGHEHRERDGRAPAHADGRHGRHGSPDRRQDGEHSRLLA